MIGWLLRATLSTLLLCLFAYVVLAIPVGRRTLFEHGAAIADTAPARELVQDVSSAMGEAVDRAKQNLASATGKRD